MAFLVSSIVVIYALAYMPFLNFKKYSSKTSTSSYNIAFEPALIPPLKLMRREGISVLEEWFRWGEEWSMLLRFYGELKATSTVLEIGCGLGRIAFPLRYVLSKEGSYDGFEICRYKVDFLQQFHQAYPHFRFTWADVLNVHYNSTGQVKSENYRFPYADETFDTIFAASVFTHLLPEATAHYFAESARVLKPGGRCLFSFFLLDYYRKGHPRPLGFGKPSFNIDHSYGGYGDEFAVSNPNDPEAISAYRLKAVERFTSEAGLVAAQEPVAGMWSGTLNNWVGAQDLVILTKA
ncbi:MAG: class I SAM-dependent methyltransferase [Elainellaceae cyanobacterium]